jgi:hypothetical protein
MITETKNYILTNNQWTEHGQATIATRRAAEYRCPGRHLETPSTRRLESTAVSDCPKTATPSDSKIQHFRNSWKCCSFKPLKSAIPTGVWERVLTLCRSTDSYAIFLINTLYSTDKKCEASAATLTSRFRPAIRWFNKYIQFYKTYN